MVSFFKSKVFIIVLVTLTILGIGAIGAWYGVNSWYKNSLEPRDKMGRDVVVTIESGQGVSDIGDLLENKAVIISSKAFGWYVSRQNVKDQLQAGTYRLSPAYSVPEIVEILANGRVDVKSVTFTPGMRLDQIEAVLKEEFEISKVREALNKRYDHPVFSFIPEGSTLEGYIYPDTYQINSESKPEDVVKMALDEFAANLEEPIKQGIEKQGLNIHQAVIIASIVQQEVPDYKTQITVAQVFLKRFRDRMPLGADPTFKYAAAITGAESSPDLDSPYNTRKNTGLPPGPIGNFLIDALRAVSSPDNTDYLYFVSGDDGITRFSKTEEEHNVLVEQYCKELCSQ
ncbi:endolytic transglycosylase MltG [Candidatus Saccharibacteria bacterium CPR2]|nr:endolytic transglycosylase MltG [Candidatus Saccharibacteria bacterium CPR2]